MTNKDVIAACLCQCYSQVCISLATIVLQNAQAILQSWSQNTLETRQNNMNDEILSPPFMLESWVCPYTHTAATV